VLIAGLSLRQLGATALVATVAFQTPLAPQQLPIFRGGTNIVPLTVSVVDKQGKPVTDLTQADFTVYENGVRQNIRSFFSQSLTPQATVIEPGIVPEFLDRAWPWPDPGARKGH
jgi:hypothetical protein